MTQFDNRYVYFFVRQDLPLAQQTIQSLHAALTIASVCPCERIPNVVLIGVPNTAELELVKSKLAKNQIGHYCFVEPDFNYGFTSIATVPLTDKQKKPLLHYKLWNENGGGAKVSACCLSVDSPTSSPVV